MAESDEVAHLHAALEQKEYELQLALEQKKLATAAAASAGTKQAQALIKDREAAERQLKSERHAHASTLKKLEGAEAQALQIQTLENTVKSLKQQMEQYQEETSTLKKLQRQKTVAIEKLQAKLDVAQDAAADASKKNSLADAQRQIQQLQQEKRLLEQELSKQSVVVARTAAQNDEEDGMIPVKQWLGERSLLQGQVKALKEKLATAERVVKSEQQVKEKLRQRIALADGQNHHLNAKQPQIKLQLAAAFAKSSKGLGNCAAHSSASRFRGSRPSCSDGTCALFEALQREVLLLRSQIAETTSLLSDKDASIEMLVKKADTLAKAKEADAKKLKREMASVQKDLAAARLGVITKEEECKERELALKQDLFQLKRRLQGSN
eukprot:jgi/Chlat1/7702/Chrsp66S07316